MTANLNGIDTNSKVKKAKEEIFHNLKRLDAQYVELEQKQQKIFKQTNEQEEQQQREHRQLNIEIPMLRQQLKIFDQQTLAEKLRLYEEEFSRKENQIKQNYQEWHQNIENLEKERQNIKKIIDSSIKNERYDEHYNNKQHYEYLHERINMLYSEQYFLEQNSKKYESSRLEERDIFSKKLNYLEKRKKTIEELEIFLKTLQGFKTQFKEEWEKQSILIDGLECLESKPEHALLMLERLQIAFDQLERQFKQISIEQERLINMSKKFTDNELEHEKELKEQEALLEKWKRIQMCRKEEELRRERKQNISQRLERICAVNSKYLTHVN